MNFFNPPSIIAFVKSDEIKVKRWVSVKKQTILKSNYLNYYKISALVKSNDALTWKNINRRNHLERGQKARRAASPPTSDWETQFE